MSNGVKLILDLLPAITKPNGVTIFLFQSRLENLEALNDSEKDIEEIEGYLFNIGEFITRLTELRDTLITEIEKDMSDTVARSVRIRDHSRADSTFVLDDPNIVHTFVELTNAKEPTAVASVENFLGIQITQLAGFVVRAEQLKETCKKK